MFPTSTYPFSQKKPIKSGRYLAWIELEDRRRLWTVSYFNSKTRQFSLPNLGRVIYWSQPPDDDVVLQTKLPEKYGKYLAKVKNGNLIRWDVCRFSEISGQRKFSVVGKVIGWLPLSPKPPV